MEHYVTLFDSLFLPQGLALHESLEKNAGDYCLWVICVDSETSDVLHELNLANVNLIKLSDVETPELIEVKKERTRVEYCWTLTPFAPRFVFEIDPKIQRVTYLDADMFFLKNPEYIFNELRKSGKKLLITDHGYAPEYDQSATSGQYCVQFMIFIRDGSEPVRKWWEDRCLEWCYAKFERGKFGDQMYLDDWPYRFRDTVYVLEHKEWMLAPWNASIYPYSNAVVYHFHGLRILGKSHIKLASYKLPKVLVKYIYEPYLESLKNSIVALNSIGFNPQKQQNKIGAIGTIKEILFGIYTQRWHFNIRHIKKFK